jgi:hypothetical protein
LISRVANWPKFANEHGRANMHRTRAAADDLRLIQAFARNDRRGKFFCVRACDWWNNIPLNIKQAKSIGQFKRLYRLFLQHRHCRRRWSTPETSRSCPRRLTPCCPHHDPDPGSTRTLLQLSQISPSEKLINCGGGGGIPILSRGFPLLPI